jgi:Zn-dependent peptidase ImmA (M78 family)
LRQLINDALLKQDWYREFLIEEGAEKVAFVGSFTVDSSALDVAAAIRSELELTLLDRRGSQDEYRRLLTERAEQSGVSVLRSGIVGANTHRRLDVEECRGFALPDPYAPLVFVNGRDFIAAQIFTLMHELAHIWIGVSGISNLDPASVPRAEYPAIEKFCNAVAAEILMPSDEVKAVWRTTMRTEVAVNFLARYFQVSKLAAVFRAKDLKLVSFSEANRLAESLEAYDGTPKGESGGNIYSTLPVRNGRSLTSAIIVAATDGRLPMTEAMRMLGVSDSVIQRAAREYGIR